jgi:hypothetical protein
VLGHEGIAGNETADQLAKIGAEHTFIGPEPACGISMGVARKAIRDWTITNLNTGDPYLDSNKQRGSYKDPLPKEQKNC